MADATGDHDDSEADRWHAERPAFFDDEDCRRALEELLDEAGVRPSRLRSRRA